MPVPPPASTATASIGPPANTNAVETAPLAPVEKTTFTQGLVSEGRRLFLAGRVIEARRRFSTAMASDDADATLSLARSYDANYLSDLQSSDAAPDLNRALGLYIRAAAQGSESAQTDLERITSTRAPAR